MESGYIVLLILAGILVFGLLAVLTLVYLIKRAAVGMFNRAVDKTIEKTAEVVGSKVLAPTMDMARDGVNRGMTAVGESIKEAKAEARRNDPKVLEVEVTRLAQTLQGELTPSQVVSRLSISQTQARDTLKRLVASQACQTELRAGELVYVFPSFKPKKLVWLCHYCDARFDQAPDTSACPSCGSQLTESSVFA